MIHCGEILKQRACHACHYVQALEMKHSEGKVDVIAHLRAQLDQLTSRNEELRQEMKAAREEAANTLTQLMKSNEKVRLTHVTLHPAEIWTMRN